MGFRQIAACLKDLLFCCAQVFESWAQHLLLRSICLGMGLVSGVFVQAARAQAPAATESQPASGAKGAPCPPPTPSAEGPTKLRTVTVAPDAKRYKIRVDKGGQNIGLPSPKNETPPAEGECFFVLAANNQDVIAEISFQRVTKNSKGVSIWVFAPVRRSEAGKITLNFFAVKASALGASRSSSAAGELVGSVAPQGNPTLLPAFVLLQNAQHQAANVRTGLALNIPVSGFGVSVESFVPALSTGKWTNMIGLRVHYLNWAAEKFVFRKPIANDNQDASATGNLLQVDVLFMYPTSIAWFPRIGVFVSPLSKQTEILKAEASSLSPQNSQTVVRSGLLLGAEAELQPAGQFFLRGRATFSSKEATTVKDESSAGESLSATGSTARLHLAGMAGVRFGLGSSGRLSFEGLVGNVYRSDKYSPEIANPGQEQQKDILTFFQAGFGYSL